MISPKSKPIPSFIRRHPHRPSTAVHRPNHGGSSDDEEEEELASPVRNTFGGAARRFLQKAKGHGRSFSSDHVNAMSLQKVSMIPFSSGSSEHDDSPPALHYGSETSSTSMESLLSTSNVSTSSLGAPIHIPERRRGRKGSLGSSVAPALSHLFGLGISEKDEPLTTPRPAPVPSAPSDTPRPQGHQRVDSISRGVPREAAEQAGNSIQMLPETLQSHPPKNGIVLLATEQSGLRKATSLKYDPSRRPKHPPTPPRQCVKALPSFQSGDVAQLNVNSTGSAARHKRAHDRSAAGPPTTAVADSTISKRLQGHRRSESAPVAAVDEPASVEDLHRDALVALTFESQQRDREIVAPLSVVKTRKTVMVKPAVKEEAKKEDTANATSSEKAKTDRPRTGRENSSTSSILSISTDENHSSPPRPRKTAADHEKWESGATTRQWSSMLQDETHRRRRPRRAGTSGSDGSERQVTLPAVKGPAPTEALPALPDSKGAVREAIVVQRRPLKPLLLAARHPVSQVDRAEDRPEVDGDCSPPHFPLPPKLDLDLSGGTIKMWRQGHQPGSSNSGGSTATLRRGRTPRSGRGMTPVSAVIKIESNAKDTLQDLVESFDIEGADVEQEIVEEPRSAEPHEGEEDRPESRASNATSSRSGDLPSAGGSAQYARWPPLQRPRPTPTSLPTSVKPYEDVSGEATPAQGSICLPAAAAEESKEEPNQQGPTSPTSPDCDGREPWNLDTLRLDLDIDEADLRLSCDDDISSYTRSSPPSAAVSMTSDGSAYSLPSEGAGRSGIFQYELASSTLTSRAVSGIEVGEEASGSTWSMKVPTRQTRPASSMYGGEELDLEGLLEGALLGEEEAA